MKVILLDFIEEINYNYNNLVEGNNFGVDVIPDYISVYSVSASLGSKMESATLNSNNLIDNLKIDNSKVDNSKIDSSKMESDTINTVTNLIDEKKEFVTVNTTDMSDEKMEYHTNGVGSSRIQWNSYVEKLKDIENTVN